MTPGGVSVLSPASHDDIPLEAGHPCFGCPVRTRAICSVLGCTDLAVFRRWAPTVRLKPGQALFHEGDRATRVFTVTRGSLKLYKLLPDGRRQVTGFVFPGDFLGIIPDEEHAVSAEALEEVELCQFPRSRFSEFVDAHPQMERQLYCFAARELGAAREQVVLLGRKTALERLATFFMHHLDRAEGDEGGEACGMDLPMGRSDIADYLGLTKETVSRLFGTLRNMGIIRLSTPHRVRVIDRAGLAKIAEGIGA